ncbi:MAG: PQQ-dependent sugar dehydrogenase [Saprospiraceae bacterium]|nr:PQQ-dependent sugar dehydrogenase [Saprospiraceae bacterium]HPG05619.1 PQQ-dependent sugar dehydrogenase [Saprospiraceae bacterium]
MPIRLIIYGYLWLLPIATIAQPTLIYHEVAHGLSRPTDIAFAPGFPDRMYVVEQGGKIRIVEQGQIISTFLDLSDRLDADSELGLLGLAFDPKFAENGIYYINFAGRIDGKLQSRVVRRFAESPGDYISSDREEMVLSFDQPYKNHNAGDIAFGPDSLLYIATGDGGSANDPAGNGQNLTTLLGKLLRIDVRGQVVYRIPEDNPFSHVTQARPEIWAYGLRNPWRISFDRETGDLWIGDVGQDKWEEISRVPANSGGLNFGWRCYEGDHFFSPCDSINQILPVYVYAHPNNCPDSRFCGESITGGFMYRGTNTDLAGLYFFADYGKNRLWALKYEEGNASQVFDFEFPYVHTSTFGEDAKGELFFATIEGSIFQIQTDASTSREADLQDQVILYPNPATTSIHLHLPPGTPGQYRWIELSGKSGGWQDLSPGGGSLPIPAVPNGVLWLQVQGPNLPSRLFMVEIIR